MTKTQPRSQAKVTGLALLAETPNCACLNVRKAARAVTQHFSGFMRDTGLKETQFSILSVLAQVGPLTMGQLADVLVMDRTSLTRTLRPMQAKKFIDIIPGQDSRTREVHMTSTGSSTLIQALPHWKAAQVSLLKELGGSDDWQSLKTQLDRLIDCTQHT